MCFSAKFSSCASAHVWDALCGEACHGRPFCSPAESAHLKLGPVDGLAPSPCAVCEVPSLQKQGHAQNTACGREQLAVDVQAGTVFVTATWQQVQQTCSMKFGIILWKIEPLKVRSFPRAPLPFSPVQRARKFSTAACYGQGESELRKSHWPRRKVLSAGVAGSQAKQSWSQAHSLGRSCHTVPSRSDLHPPSMWESLRTGFC